MDEAALTRWGIAPGYRDVEGSWKAIGDDAAQALLDAMGADPSGAPPAPREPVERKMRCHPAGDVARWGFAVQVYSLWSDSSWGIGDFADLERFNHFAAGAGASFTMVSPLHAPSPGPAPQPSPYFPGSRCFLNPLYIAVDELVGDGGGRASGRSLTRAARVDHAAAWKAKRAALEQLWRDGRRDAQFEDFVEERGATLEAFATFSALADELGPDWRTWPTALRHPANPEVARWRRAHAEQVGFHAWLQHLCEHQLQRAADALPLVTDIAVGVDPAGADGWIWQECFADGVSAGAPPDAFNAEGQDWGVLAFDPWRLRTAAYEPFVEMLRAGMRHAAGVRIDHVMALWRLFWIPAGRSPGEGGYVHYPHDDLLGIVARESARARAFVVGEDLGTVEPEVRAEMAARAMLGYRLLWFDPDPTTYPELSLAAVTNHDLATVAGVVTGDDVAEARRRGMALVEEAEEGLRKTLAEVVGGAAAADPRAAAIAAYRAAAAAPSRVFMISLEDGLGLSLRPNYPGTASPDNWTHRLPLAVDDIESSDVVAAIVAAVTAARPGSTRLPGG